MTDASHAPANENTYCMSPSTSPGVSMRVIADMFFSFDVVISVNRLGMMPGILQTRPGQHVSDILCMTMSGAK